MHRLALPLVTALLIAAGPNAAETLTVGPAGSGAQYATLSAASDASQPHDTILVYSGSYFEGGFVTVRHPLRIVGIGKPSLSSEIRISYFPHEFEDATVLAGLRVSAPPPSLFEYPPESLYTQEPTVLVDCYINNVQISYSSAVIDGCEIWDLRGVGTSLWINASTLRGNTHHGFWPTFADGVGLPAALLTECTTSISGSALTGGEGHDHSCEEAKATGGDALVLIGGSAVLRGGPGALLQGGVGAHDACFDLDLPGGYALSTYHGATVTLQAELFLAGGADGSAGAHASLSNPAAVSVVTTVYPTLSVAQPVLAPGAATTLSLAGEPGAASLAYSALVSTTFSAPWIEGTVHLQQGAITVRPVMLPPSGALALPLALPPDPVLTGLAFTAQLLTTGGTVISDPAHVAIH
jgi:hypothetical protein